MDHKTLVPSPIAHQSVEFIETSGGVESYRLKANDLHILLLAQDVAPVVTFMVTYDVGSGDEASGLTGATHFLEHLMFKGTNRYNKRRGTSVFNVLQRVGAQVNASTWIDRTNYYALLPTEFLPLAVEIEADRMRGALITVEDMEAERTVILNERDRGENEPLRKLYQTVWSMAFLAHPYHHPTIGWRGDLEHMTVEGLRHFYNTYYWPDNATVSIIGDFNRPAVLDLVEQHFGAIPRAPAPIPTVRTREPEQIGERRLVVRAAGHVGAIMSAYKAPSALHPDADALDVLTRILAGGKSGRLYRRLTDQGLTAQVTATMARTRDPGLFYFLALLSPGRTHEEVEQAMQDVVAQVQEEGITEAELKRAKNQLRVQEAFSRDGSYAIAAQLNEAIAAGDWRLFTTARERLERITAEDIQRVARTYLVEDSRTVGWYVPA